MKSIFRNKTDKSILIILIGLFILAALVCFLCAYNYTHMLDSQFEAERWQGESEESFSQISCFLPADGKLDVSDINNYRGKMVQKLDEASVDLTESRPFIDCWSCEDSTKAYGMYNGTASIVACGGNFFAFHPLKLVTGNYFSGDDLMQDNVLLDEDLAWLLFGGNDLEGQTVYLYNLPFRVAGVVARESDQATEKAYSGGLGLFMSYDAYMDICSGGASEDMSENGESAADGSRIRKYGITCYEVCMPNPVEGFAVGVVQSEFPIGTGEIVENTGRFRLLNLLKIAKDFSVRSIHDGPAFSYWENAARYAENKAAILIVAGAVLLFLPAAVLLVLLIKRTAYAGEKIREDLLPEMRDKIEESVRKRQRKRWEKRHGVQNRES